MNLWSALLLGVVEGVTEFLPVSSTGHLTIVEKLLSLPIDDAGVTAFTAIIQVGAIAAVVLYFWADVVRLVTAWVRGLRSPHARGNDYREAWVVIVGSVPVAVVGFLARDLVSGPLRNLWVVVAALVVWSAVMWAAERAATARRGERDVTLRDAAVIGVMQCVALVPGVSRSGATISAGLFRGLDRVTATRISFFLSIPALVAAGGYEAATSAADVGATVGWGATAVATLVSFAVAYAAIAWLLRLVARRPISVFVGYRVALAAVVAVLLATGVVSAT
ncbi:undecaprenyl-diphosphate phosphatase [Xylanimonas protaetiae]|uniref:Undecaprenyl-diphosphatase n=1 Tax=Xylanimonas protaetiae TaxID=2509457 RepID=A0A4V0YGE5_9MICO|nr:undecaprenyl-diphosphate phosphatase [Xylanimonas protaetiae]QAY70931.1 undecaprenyl-diphosphate phosphatase [Xylanimonas protaetiae]